MRSFVVALSLGFLSVFVSPAIAVDSDGDGLDDAVEETLGTNPGLADSDGDLIDDFAETNGGSPVDSDADGLIDALDDDSDGDGYGDRVETDVDSDGDGIADYRDFDSDDDSVPDRDEFDGDIDADGLANRIDPDDDGDGIPTVVEGTVDTDADGNLDYFDLDSDGDGFSDAVEGAEDADRDGTPNYVDLDSDDDTVPDLDELDADSDLDTVPNRIDGDDDGDGIDTRVERTFDSDGDGTADYLDLDSDDDSVPDADELGAETDTDSDGSPNRVDPDDDGDGYGTIVEGTVDTDGDATPDYLDFDSDGDTVPDRDEFDGDFDADGASNRVDDDDDGDGISTSVEGTFDTDGDGNFDYLDLDSDGDGLPDAEEGVEDPDGDGSPNYVDTDSDGDGFTDTEESVAGSDPYDSASTPETVTSPVIAGVTDVGNDQGRRLRLRWARSSLDVLGSTEPIVDYAVYRRIDAGLGPHGDGPLLRAPAGEWEFVSSIPATTEPAYATVVPSLCDSTAAGPCWSVYFVRALTASPGAFYDSAPDSGMSVDNLAPSAPTGFTVDYGAQNTLTWEPSPEADFRYFKVYRGTGPDLSPETASVVHTTVESGWADPDGDPGAVYLVSAVDFAGNEGPAAAADVVTGTGEAPRLRAALEQNVPNPFNPRTSIAFRLAEAGPVTLRVHDSAGRLVRVLVDERDHAAGRHVVVWDGTDASGSKVAAGVYLYSLSGPGIERSRRMVLVK